MRCRHNFEYSQGHFRCSKCGMRAKEKQFKRNHNKSYATIGIVGLVIMGGIYAYANYDITVADQKIDQMLPLKTVEQKFDELYQTIPTESIDSAIQEFSESIPIKIEQKQTKIEDKLLDCSQYKKEYLEANKNVRSTEDNMAAMMGDALAGVQKTKACEEYNRQIMMQQTIQDTSDPSFIETVPNKIKISSPSGVLYGEFTPVNLKVIENPRYNEIIFSVNVKIIDLPYNGYATIEVPSTTLIDENSQKYMMNLVNCGDALSLFVIIDGGKTDTASFIVCYDIGKDVKNLDIMFKGFKQVNDIDSTVKIGTIHIKN